MSYSTSVTAVPTTASPTTSTPITTYSGSSNAPSSTTPGSTGTTPIANSMTSVATSVPTTITSTNSYGSTTVITTHTYTTTPVAVPTPSPVNNSSNTGAIVGGVVGGLAAIALLALLFFWLRRRRRRGQSDGKYVQDRIEPQPSGGGTHIDLGEDPVPAHDVADMREYGDSPFRGASADAAEMGVAAAAAGAGTRRASSQPSPSLQHSVASASHSGDPSQRFVRPGPGEYSQGGPSIHATQQADTPRPLTSPASSVVASSSGRMMKEQEAAAGRQGFGLSTQQEAEGEGSGVVQHRDAGQALGEEGGGMRDIPPAYESISQ